MRITRKQYDKAQKDLPKLKTVEQTIKTWNDAIKAIGPAAEHQEIVELEQDEDGEWTWKAKKIKAKEPLKS